MAVDIEGFLSALEASQRTKIAYRTTLGPFDKFLNGRDPSEEAVEEFLHDRAKKGRATSSLCRDLSALRTYFLWLKKRAPKEKRPDYDLVIKGPKVSRKLPRMLSAEEIRRLVNAAETPFEKALVMVTYDGALRIGELMGLRAEDIDWDEGYIRIVRKGGEETRIPLGGEALNALRKYCGRQKAQLFPEPYGKHYQTVRSVASRAGIKKVTPHTLRHARAIDLRRQGVPLEDIRDFLGHSQLQTTLIYARIMPEVLKRRIPPAF